MTIFVKKAPNLSGVADGGSTMTLTLPVGAKEIEKVMFDLAGTTKPKTAFSNHEVKVNGVTIQNYKTTAHLENIMGYYGLDVNSDEIAFPFNREFLQNAAHAAAFNLGLGDVDTFQISSDISDAVSADIAVTAWYQEIQRRFDGMSAAQANALGVFTRVRNFVYTLSGAGETEIDNIPKQGFLQAMHLIQSSDVITNAELWAGETKIWDASASRMERLVERSGRVRQSATYHIDMMLKNELGEQVLLDGLSDYRLKLAHSAGATLTIYHETMDSWRGE